MRKMEVRLSVSRVTGSIRGISRGQCRWLQVEPVELCLESHHGWKVGTSTCDSERGGIRQPW